MFKAGIIDPTKVVKTALRNAASIAGLMLTTEALVTKFDQGRRQEGRRRQHSVMPAVYESVDSRNAGHFAFGQVARLHRIRVAGNGRVTDDECECSSTIRIRHRASSYGITPLHMATQRDYYEVLGVERTATNGEIADGVSQAGREVSPRQEPGRRGSDRAVQGGGRGVRGAQRRGQAVALRSLRPRRPQRPDGAHHFTDVEDIFSAFGDIFGDLFGGGGSAIGSTKAATCAAT